MVEDLGPRGRGARRGGGGWDGKVGGTSGVPWVRCPRAPGIRGPAASADPGPRAPLMVFDHQGGDSGSLRTARREGAPRTGGGGPRGGVGALGGLSERSGSRPPPLSVGGGGRNAARGRVCSSPGQDRGDPGDSQPSAGDRLFGAEAGPAGWVWVAGRRRGFSGLPRSSKISWSRPRPDPNPAGGGLVLPGQIRCTMAMPGRRGPNGAHPRGVTAADGLRGLPVRPPPRDGGGSPAPEDFSRR